MGSKYRLLPHLSKVFHALGGTTAVDAFSGSGVVSYLLKAQGYSVVSNDSLAFSSTITRATVENSTARLTPDVVDQICGPPRDGRDFIEKTFSGIFFTPGDLRFLDSAWSHIEGLRAHERDLAITALLLAAARKQPRGVFTFAGFRYDDNRRNLRLSLREHFRECVREYNALIFDSGKSCVTYNGDVFNLPELEPDLVYLDPPYAPPTDDTDYIRRYHFLEGLSVYWQGVDIMEHTKTKKIAKRFTPFAYKRTIEGALTRTFEKFQAARAIVLSYSSNALPDSARLQQLLREFKPTVEVQAIDHSYSFGTHASATRRRAQEYIIIGRD